MYKLIGTSPCKINPIQLSQKQNQSSSISFLKPNIFSSYIKMATFHHLTLTIAILALVSSFASATDPNQLQDFCVATDKNPGIFLLFQRTYQFIYIYISISLSYCLGLFSLLYRISRMINVFSTIYFWSI